MQSVDWNNGQPLWKTELGGEITAELQFENDSIFAVSENSTPLGAVLTVTSLSSSTGIPQWQTRISTENLKGIYALMSGRMLVVATAQGKIYLLDKETGKIIREHFLKSGIISKPFSISQNEIIINSEKSVSLLSISKNQITQLIAVKDQSRIYYADQQMFLLGDALGNVSAYSLSSKKRLWRIRTGAETSDVVALPEGFMISSNDNFVYFVSLNGGRRQWRTRLPQRTRGAFVTSQTAAFSDLSGTNTVFLESRYGKPVNRISLSEGDSFVARLSVFGNTVYAPTERGVTAYSSTGCSKKGVRN